MSNIVIPNSNSICSIDTDGIKITVELPSSYVDQKEIGKFKLEGIYKKYISTGPKVYAGIYLDQSQEVKVKGLKKEFNNLNLSFLEYLLYPENFLSITQEN